MGQLTDVTRRRRRDAHGPRPTVSSVLREKPMGNLLGVRDRGRSILAGLACSAMLAAVLIGVGQGPAAAATPPVANNDSYATNTSSPLVQAATGGVLTNDTDDGPAANLVAHVVTTPAHGSLTLNGNGSFTYTPTATDTAKFVGTD